MPAPMTLLDEVLPEFHVRERHSIRLDASAEQVFEALRSVTLAELPAASALVRLRGIGAAADRPLLEQMQRAFRPLAEEPGRQLVLGSIGRSWRWRGGRTPSAEFGSFSEPGWAKMAIDFRYEGGVLSTETRVLLTDAAARRRFRLYWLAIRPFSGLLRRLLLRAVRRRLEPRG